MSGNDNAGRQRHRRPVRGNWPALAIVALPALLMSLWATLAPVKGDVSDDERPQAEELPYPHGEYEAECSLCHDPEGWVPARISEKFDHAASGFALDGAHSRTMCRSCHFTLEFQETKTLCVDCHQDVHRGELGIDCRQCHTTTNFVDRIDELRSHRLTRFPLSGAHATLDCESCHQLQPQGGLMFVNTPVDCEACHLPDYQATTSPNHQLSGFSRDCVRCHTVLTWQQARFDHSTTGFPLQGAHGALDCAECHTSGQSAGLAAQCFSCHQQDYEGADDPSHVTSGFPTECQECHSSAAWEPANFDHNRTGFPLAGAHSGLNCQECHVGGQFAGTPAQCLSCHQQDYQQAANPNHLANGFPTDCQECHSSNAWRPAAFDHNLTNFPLTGSHIPLNCQACHAGGVFADTSTDCIACHQSAYNGATDHTNLGLPTECEPCHSTLAWGNVDYGFHEPFDVDYGPHEGPCSDCHISGTTASFSCFGACHKHTEGEMDDKHREVDGYVYDFPTCLVCHPDGRH